MSPATVRIGVAVVFVLVAVLLSWIAVRRTRQEPRRLSNGILLGLAAVAVLEALGEVGVPGANLLIGLAALVVILSPLLVLVLAALLILNGVQMVRRESRSLGNLLSLVLGLVLVGLAALPFLVLLAGGGLRGLAVVAGLSLVVGYFGFALINFLVYAQIYRRLTAGWPARWVVVLGSGLGADGRVTALLASRVSAGLAAAAGLRAEVIVMSGGQGEDEVRPEAEAMAEWAVEKGADPARVLVEPRSRNTEQNLRHTARLLRSGSHVRALPPADDDRAPAADPPVAPGRDGLPPGLIVTSNYHVMRAALLARRLGIPAQASGAPTAWYYWPSAVLREFVAVLAEHPWRHLVASVLIAAPLPLLVLLGS